MRTLAIGAGFAGMLLITGSGPLDPLPSPLRSEARVNHANSVVSMISPDPARLASVPAATLTDVVQRYCVMCHNDQLRTADLSLQTFEVERAPEQAETAEKMIRKLRAGLMPPPGAPRPESDTLLLLVETLEAEVDRAARGRGPSSLGARRFQRLGRAEYERVVHDLLGLEVDAGSWLPPDVLLGAFDNQSASQPFSPTLVDAFLRAATEISRLAVGNPEAAPSTVKLANSERASQHAWDHVDGAPFGSRGGMVVTHHFPADGEYVLEAFVSGGRGNGTWFEDLDISIDGEPVALLKLEHNGGNASHQTEPIFVHAGQRQVSAAFVNLIEGPYEDRFVPSASSATADVIPGGITSLAHLNELWITGPANVSGVSDSESRRKVFTCYPTSPEEERPCARAILSELANKASRRPVPEESLVELMRLYDEAASRDGFEIGIRMGLQTILMSPDFLFRLERVPPGTQAGQSYRLNDVDLAARLSFLLWASMPDEELLEVAAGGRLSDPAMLEEQVQRMLEDPRSEALATRFAHQWLRLEDVGKVWPHEHLYPDFSTQLAEAMVRETQLFFHHLVQENRSLLDLLSADYTFLNERLARHYGIAGVQGDAFRRVTYPDDRRTGIFGHGSVLQLTSMGDRTSPVLRGKWVMEVVMGTPPPPPPPNVPPFDASPAAGEGRLLTTRERMELHRAAPVCNSCHRFMDPIGLALDNLDAVGQWRIRENMVPLDTRGELYDGTPITAPGELAAALLRRPIVLARNFTEQLLTYAIGRPLEYYDQPTVRSIAQGAQASNYQVREILLGVVKSEMFQTGQTQSTAN